MKYILKAPNLTLIYENVIADFLSQNRASSGQVKGARKEDRSNNVLSTGRDGASAGGTRMDFGSVPNWLSNECCRECARLMDVERFGTMVVYGKNIIL